MRRLPPRRPKARPRPGAAAVEFAIAVPILLLLAFGCADLGRAIAAYVAVSNSAAASGPSMARHMVTRASPTRLGRPK